MARGPRYLCRILCGRLNAVGSTTAKTEQYTVKSSSREAVGTAYQSGLSLYTSQLRLSFKLADGTLSDNTGGTYVSGFGGWMV